VDGGHTKQFYYVDCFFHDRDGFVTKPSLLSDHTTSQCSEIIMITTDSLDDRTLKQLLISVQMVNIGLCVKYAIESCDWFSVLCMINGLHLFSPPVALSINGEMIQILCNGNCNWADEDWLYHPQYCGGKSWSGSPIITLYVIILYHVNCSTDSKA